MIKRIIHIGVVVEDFDGAVNKFKEFGLTCDEINEGPTKGDRIAFFPVGDTSIEFLSFAPSKGSDTTLNLVRSQKGPINHLCFEVDNLEATIRDFEHKGARLLEGCPRPGAHGRVAFFYPETTEGILIELCQL